MPTRSTTPCPTARPSSTRKSPTTCRSEFNRADGSSSEGRQGHGRLRPHVLNAGWPPRPKPSTNRSAVAANAWRNASAKSNCSRRGAARPARRRLAPRLTPDDLDDLDDAPDAEVEETEEPVVDQATAAQTIAELEAEIAILRTTRRTSPYESAAAATTANGTNSPSCSRTISEMFDAHGHRRKLVIFTEHRDTLNYLRRQNPRAARPAGGRRHHPRRHGPRGAHARRRSLSPRTRTSRSSSPPTPPAKASTSSAPT